MSRRRLGAMAVVLCVAAACTGRGDPSGPRSRDRDAPAPRPGGTVVFGVVGAPATLDPYSDEASDLTRALVRPLYPSLFRFLPDGRTQSYLAESLRRRGRRTEVRLRAARWSTGRRITAADVAASARRAAPPSGFAAFAGVRAPTPRTVVFEGAVRRPERALAAAAFVLPRGQARTLPTVSGGPFVAASFRPGLELVLEPNPRWRGEVLLERVKVRFVQTLRQLLALLEEGRLDAAAPPSFVNLDDVVGPGVRLAAAEGWEAVFVDFRDSGLSRPERAAVAAGVDRRAIHEAFIREAGRVADTLPAALGRGEGLSSEAEGDAPVERVQISVPAGDELLELMQKALYRQLEREGIEADLVAVDQETFYGLWQSANPTDAALRRAVAAPPYGASGEDRAGTSAYPLFRVTSFTAALPDVRGVAPNPTFDGPLWNAQRWWRAGS